MSTDEMVVHLESERMVSPDRVIRYKKRILQMEAAVAVGARVLVEETPDGALRISHNGEELPWRQIHAVVRVQPKRRGRRPPLVRPPATHPWKRERTVALREPAFFSATAYA